MTDHEDNQDSPPGSDQTAISGCDAGDNLPNKLTPEEQMALYEKELKEDDWGHQPC